MSQKDTIWNQSKLIISGMIFGVVIGIALCIYLKQGGFQAITSECIILNWTMVFINLMMLLKTRQLRYFVMIILCMMQVVQ